MENDVKCGDDAAVREEAAPRDLKRGRIHSIIAAVCIALLTPAAFLSLCMVDGSAEEPTVWDTVCPLAVFLCCMALLYGACAWSQLAFAMKKRLPQLSGFWVFTAALFPLWFILSKLAILYCLYTLLLSPGEAGFALWLRRGNHLAALVNSLEGGVWLLPLPALLIMIFLLVLSFRVKTPAPEAVPAPELIAALRRNCLRWLAAFGAAAVAAFLFLFLYWFFRIREMDYFSTFCRQLGQESLLIFIAWRVVLVLILTWLLNAWNALMLELKRAFVWRFALDLLLLLIFLTGECIQQVMPFLIFIPAAAPVVIDLIRTRPRKTPAPDAGNSAANGSLR